jgi:hypothetical protein
MPIERARLKIEEEDGTPTGRPITLKVSNTTLTDNGDYTSTLFSSGVAVDSSATSGYLGNAIGDGVLRASAPLTYTDGGNFVTLGVDQSAIDHGTLAGLGDDDHTQYLLLAGRAGSQTAYGGTASGEDMIIYSTAHATKGRIKLEDNTFIGDYATYAATYGAPASNRKLIVYGQIEEHRLTNFTFKPIGTSVAWQNYGYQGIGGLDFFRAQGSDGAEASIVNGAILNETRVWGYHENGGGVAGGAYYQAAEMGFTVDAAIGASAEVPCRWELSLTADGASTPTQALRVGNDGNMRVGSTNSAAVSKLHVEGDIRLGTGAGDPFIYFDSTSDGLITWDVSETEFDFSADINVTGGGIFTDVVDVTFTTSTIDDSGFVSDITMGADVDGIGCYAATLTGLAAGGSGGNLSYCYAAEPIGDNNDSNHSYVSYLAESFVSNGGAGSATAFKADSGYFYSFFSDSGNVKFVLNADEIIEINALNTTHSLDAVVTYFNIDTTEKSAYNTTLTLMADVDACTAYSASLVGLAAGGTLGNTTAGYSVDIQGDAQDSDHNYVGFVIANVIKNGTNQTTGFSNIDADLDTFLYSLGGDAQITFGATEFFNVTASAHTNNEGIMNINVTSGTDGVSGIDVTMTSTELSGSEKELLGIISTPVGHASDDEDAFLAAYEAGSFVSNGGSAASAGYVVGTGYELALVMESGVVAWEGTQGRILVINESEGNGPDLVIYPSDGYTEIAGNTDGGNLILFGGSKTNSGNDGFVAVDSSEAPNPTQTLDPDSLYVKNILEVTGISALYGGMVMNRTTVNAATYAVLTADQHISVTYTATGTVVVTLPAISATNEGQVYHIKDAGYNASTNNITINPTGADKVENTTSATINASGTCLTFVANNATKNWEVQ